MFNRILVAIDRSTTSRKVFEEGMFLAKVTGASLMLLHVLSSEEQDYPTPFVYSGLEYDPSCKPILEAYQEQLRKFEWEGIEFLRSLEEEATKAGINTDYTQTWGYPGHHICEKAQTWAAELILVGSRGLTGLEEMFLGSISNYVSHHAPCSVLIVRDNAHLAPKSSISMGEYA